MAIIQTATVVEIPEEDRVVLENWHRSSTIEHRLRQRAWIVLLCGQGLGSRAVARKVEIATGKITGQHRKRRRRREFSGFMNDIVAQHEGRENHVILDNLNTHKPKNDRWLARHKNVHFHYTPTSASWLSQVEIWFSILAGQSLKGARRTA